MKKILIKPDAFELQDLQELIEKSSHQVLVLWALDCATTLLGYFEIEFPQDNRPRLAILKGYRWAEGLIKMPEAKKAILEAHQSATDHEDNLFACALARAIGQGVSTIHVRTHAIGIVIYGVTAFLRHSNNLEETVIIKDKVDWFYQRLSYWQTHVNDYHTWASFLLRKEP